MSKNIPSQTNVMWLNDTITVFIPLSIFFMLASDLCGFKMGTIIGACVFIVVTVFYIVLETFETFYSKENEDPGMNQKWLKEAEDGDQGDRGAGAGAP